jgi:uncharacterized DUF497 family protein
MEERQIVCDENKNAENKLKHKIGFEDAQFVFADPDLYDCACSPGEQVGRLSAYRGL